MTSQEKRNLEKIVSKINQQNNIKKENTTNDKYFNSVFAKSDAYDLSETSEGGNLFKLIFLNLPVIKYKHSPWKS